MTTKKPYGFPDPLAKDSEKKDNDYGLKIAKSIANEWFDGGMISDKCEYAARRDWIRENRLFVRGEQDITPYKEHFERNSGDLDYANLDWTLLNIAEKFCNIVSNGIHDNYYRLDIRAVDKITAKVKKDKQDFYKKTMRAKALFENTKKALGIDLLPKGFIPDDEEEMALYLEIKERPKIEIAEELIINYVKKTSDWDSIEEAKNKDLVINGVAGVRVYTDKTDGVKTSYVDPEYLVHSFVRKNDFSDAFYFGEVDSLTINDIKRESDFDEKTLRYIAKSYASKNSNFSPAGGYESCSFEDIVDVKVDILRFSFKTTKNIVYKKAIKKGGHTKLSKKDDNYDPPERNDYGKLDQVLDTWYEGCYIIGTDFIYDYQECENIERDERNKAKSPYNVIATDIYKNSLRSFTSNIKPLVNQMQYIHLKMQHLLAELKPDLTIINLDQLAELGDGEGGAKQKDWKQALNILNVKGVVFEKTIDMGEMGAQRGQAATTRATQQGSALTALLNSWAHYYNLIRDITGVNPVRDGSQAHDSLVGTNEMALLASNTATQHIVNASTMLNKKVCETISSRIHSIFKHKEAGHLKEIYAKAIGRQNIDALEALSGRHLHDFGFTVEMMPTQEEVKEFKEDLMVAMQEGYIDVEDKQQAQQIFRSNHKLANQYLQYRRRVRKKEMQEQREQEAQLQSQSNAQAAQAGAQAQAQVYAQQAQIDLKKAQSMMQLEILKEQALFELKMKENAQDFKYDAYLKQMDVASNLNLNKYKEDKKDERLNTQSSHQSKLIDQRDKKSAPIAFDNDFDISSMLG